MLKYTTPHSHHSNRRVLLDEKALILEWKYLYATATLIDFPKFYSNEISPIYKANFFLAKSLPFFQRLFLGICLENF